MHHIKTVNYYVWHEEKSYIFYFYDSQTSWATSIPTHERLNVPWKLKKKLIQRSGILWRYNSAVKGLNLFNNSMILALL